MSTHRPGPDCGNWCPSLFSRIRGCILGAALGDAAGAPFEFRPIEFVVEKLGGEWIDGLYPFEGEPGSHGVWASPAPAGTATDDTRYNWVVLELAAELGRAPSAEDLARRSIDVWERPGSVIRRFSNSGSSVTTSMPPLGTCCNSMAS